MTVLPLTRKCNVIIKRLTTKITTSVPVTKNNNAFYNMWTRPSKEVTPHRTSEHPRAVIDYSQFMSGNETDISISPPHKQWTVNLMWMPSSSRIASQNFHTKPSNTPRPIRNAHNTTVTIAANNEETKIAIDALLSLGNDMIPDDDITVENAVLVSSLVLLLQVV